MGVTVLSGVILLALLVYLIRVAYVTAPPERALSDRFRLGYVVDYLDLYVGQYHWPAFDLADSAVSIGALWLALLLARGRASGPGRTQARGAPRVSQP